LRESTSSFPQDSLLPPLPCPLQVQCNAKLLSATYPILTSVLLIEVRLHEACLPTPGHLRPHLPLHHPCRSRSIERPSLTLHPSPQCPPPALPGPLWPAPSSPCSMLLHASFAFPSLLSGPFAPHVRARPSTLASRHHSCPSPLNGQPGFEGTAASLLWLFIARQCRCLAVSRGKSPSGLAVPSPPHVARMYQTGFSLRCFTRSY
jgi:hypothetical protein